MSLWRTDIRKGAWSLIDVLLLPSICSNTKLSEQYLSLARDLDVMEAKTAEDVYKMHLVEGRAPTGEGDILLLHGLVARSLKMFTRCTWWRGGHPRVRGIAWCCLDWLPCLLRITYVQAAPGGGSCND